MTWGPEWARSIGNPTVAGPNQSFPFDRNASRALEYVPAGLVVSPAVLSEFLDPPDARGDWFCNVAWQEASQLLREDDAITADEYQDLIARFNSVQDALVGWAAARPEMPDGYAESLSPAERRRMSTALAGIWSLNRGQLATLSAREGLADDTKRALENVSQVLWEYFQSMAFELEASHDGLDVTAVRDRFEREAEHPWEPALTPDNVGEGGITIGGQRLPSTPDTPTTSEPVADPTSEPGTEEPATELPPEGTVSDEPAHGEGEVGE